ncbi:MAG: arginine deiminase family protein, partial [Methanomicrobium sp.]|nr:arginine deiminase family protein [Methanomicrobium sp.]
MNRFGAYSEAGRLKKVLLQRPDLSLRRLTPQNHDEFLFDEIIWVDEAAREHDCFAKVLIENGVTVYYLQNLLEDVVSSVPGAKESILNEIVTENTAGFSIKEPLLEYLTDMEPKELAARLTGGLTVSEALGFDIKKYKKHSLFASNSSPDDFLLPPLPNTLYTRDSSCWIYGGVSVNPMFRPVRRRESVNIAAIYRHHTLFSDTEF